MVAYSEPYVEPPSELEESPFFDPVSVRSS